MLIAQGSHLIAHKFYQQDTLTLAQALLGSTLIHESNEGRTAGIIVETEAYLYNDPACHAYRKQTPRNAPMFGKAGTVYVYQIYGLHFCVNVVSNQEGIGEAVLIRALAPTEGLSLMAKRRFGNEIIENKQIKSLCNGPANLVKAMGIDKSMNGFDLQDSILTIDYQVVNDFEIVTTTRVGITQGAELPYRFYIEENRFVSKK